MKKKNKFLIQQSIILLILTIFFTIIVFLIKNYYFSAIGESEEEKYLDPVPEVYETVVEQLDDNKQEEIIADIKKEEIVDSKIDEVISGAEITQLIEDHYRTASPFYFEYFPETFEKQALRYTIKISDFLQSQHIKQMVYDVKIELHKPLYDVRGKMKDKILKLYGVSQMTSEEFLSVSIHEFSHYIDIYFLEKKVIKDTSDYFYEISWDETRVLKPGENQSNFVSGYAMTNKYEDFAESFTYYILHNGDFLKKAEESEKLMKKYEFFHVYLFKDGDFTDTNFSIDDTIKNYYRDITKIDIDLEKLLQYLKNGI